jgi:subtilisin-like proprotein convertase family protein
MPWSNRAFVPPPGILDSDGVTCRVYWLSLAVESTQTIQVGLQMLLDTITAINMVRHVLVVTVYRLMHVGRFLTPPWTKIISGFGMVSTVDALNRASSWQNFREEKQLMNETGSIDLPIADSPAASFTTSSLTFSELASANFVIESVVVYLDIWHPSRGDIKVILVSPGGTESILHPSKRPEDAQLRDDDMGKWKLLTLRSWGEFPTGVWTLGVKDEKPGSLKACHDLPWEFVYPKANGEGNETLTCNDFAGVTRCNDDAEVNPGLLTILYEGRTLVESCCPCGGGQKTADITPTLRSWKLLLYGHIIESPEELLIFPPLNPSPSESNKNNTQGGDDNASGDSDRNVTKPDEILGWDDRGNSGEFSGGGGNAFYSGWRPGDPIGSRNNNNNGSDGRRNIPVSAAMWLMIVMVSRDYIIV